MSRAGRHDYTFSSPTSREWSVPGLTPPDRGRGVAGPPERAPGPSLAACFVVQPAARVSPTS